MNEIVRQLLQDKIDDLRDDLKDNTRYLEAKRLAVKEYEERETSIKSEIAAFEAALPQENLDDNQSR